MSLFGIPSRPDSAILVTTGSTCDSVLAAHNAHFAVADTGLVVSSAIIAKLGPTYVVGILRPTVGYKVFYDSTLTYRGIYEISSAAPADRGDFVRRGCAPNTDAALENRFLTTITTGLRTVDSVEQARLGLPTVPDTAMVLTVNSTCDSVLAAHNAYAATIDSMYVESSTLIAAVGPSYFIRVVPLLHPHVQLWIYDSTLTFRRIWE